LRPAAGRRSFAEGAAPEDPLTRVLLLFAALVVVYDALASALIAVTGWPYNVLALGALVIQVAAGRAGGARGGFGWAILSGGCTALAEATLGFAVAWLIGPGRTQLPNVDYPTAVALATLGGCALGGLGGITALGWDVESRKMSPGRLASGLRSFLRSLSLDAWLVRALLLRGMVIWAGIRLLFLLATSGAGMRLTSDLAAGARLLVICALVAVVDLAWRREFVLLADLGVRPGVAVLLYAVPGVLFESILLVVVR
jgi:hypothetical protein